MHKRLPVQPPIVKPTVADIIEQYIMLNYTVNVKRVFPSIHYTITLCSYSGGPTSYLAQRLSWRPAAQLHSHEWGCVVVPGKEGWPGVLLLRENL